VPSTAELGAASAAERLARGELVAYPTETVWGLAADSRSEPAVAALRAWKGRGQAQPISVLVSSAKVLPALGCELNETLRALAERFWPGPLTLVVPCAGDFAAGLLSEAGGLGLRCSAHPAALALAAAAEAAGLGPPTATSLNRSGEPPARDEAAARACCAAPGDPRLLASEREAGGGTPSTVLDLCGARPRVLRAGAISEEDWMAALGLPSAAAPRPSH
jgi:L-threonylcarbamoyladenylate synthase